MRQNGDLYTIKKYIKFVKQKYKKFNKNEGKKDKYKCQSFQVPRQSEHVDLLDFPGIQTTLWLRSRFSNTGHITSIINYISPWETSKVKQIHTKQRLDEMKIDKKTTYRKANLSEITKC